MKVGGVVGGLCVMGAVLQPCLLQGGCRYQARFEGQHWIISLWVAIALGAERYREARIHTISDVIAAAITRFDEIAWVAALMERARICRATKTPGQDGVSFSLPAEAVEQPY